jgi:uncharacterized membrane-anchored protein YitT (DUF2179 family)
MKTKAINAVKAGRKHPVAEEIMRFGSIIVGALFVAVGLEAFLIPNGFLDGGITGISILIANFLPVPMGVILGILNIPFIILTWLKVGHMSAIRTAVGIAVLAVATIVLHHMDPWTEEFFLALAYGGALLGVGIGLALRQGGALDGMESLASILSKSTRYSVDQLILVFNIVIFIVASFIVGPQQALASAALFYLAVAPMIKRVVDGDTYSRRARVATSKPAAVAEALRESVSGRILMEGSSVFENGEFTTPSGDISFTIPRLQEASVTETILDIDPDAIVVFLDIASLRGGSYEQKGH